jgi:precorrin-8X/cobalt-precorrin-8 methylmutase
VTRTAPHPIERESYRILRARIDLSHLPPLSRAVAERIVHASADVSIAATLVLDEAALERGRAALVGGAPVVCDANMAAAGITRRAPLVPLADPRTAERAVREGTTRSAAAMRIAADEVGPGAVWVVGNAPTALAALLDDPPADPALIVGLPVGFVGAAEAKAALATAGLPCVTNHGERGGSAMAAAAVNALLSAG